MTRHAELQRIIIMVDDKQRPYSPGLYQVKGKFGTFVLLQFGVVGLCVYTQQQTAVDQGTCHVMGMGVPVLCM